MLNIQQTTLVFCAFSIATAMLTCSWQIAILMFLGFATSLAVSIKSVLNLSNKRKALDSSWIVTIVSFVSKVKLYFSAKPKIRQEQVNLELINIEKQTDLIVDYVSRDFIQAWFSALSDSVTVINENKNVLSDLKRTTLHVLSQSNKYKQLQKSFILYHKHLQEYQKAQNFINIQPKYRLKRDRSQEFKKIVSVDKVFEVDGLFHHAMNSEEREIIYFNSLLDLCLKEMLVKDVYKCKPACDLVLDITSTNGVVKLLEFVSDPHWLHFFIIKLTSDEDLEMIEAPHIEPQRQCHQTSSCGESAGSICGTVSTTKEVNFYFDPEEHNETGERPNPLGCAADAVSNDPSLEVGLAKDDKRVENFSSSIEIAERNGLFDLNLFPRSISGQSFEDSMTSQIEEAEDAWAKAPERYERPLNLVVELNIPKSEKMREPGPMGSYTIYVIEYLAWYKTEGGTWHVQGRAVKRRYREFVALQERLEEHPQLKHQLKKIKGIKGPSKWLNLPFSRMDEAYINKRRLFLTEYLRSIVDNQELSYSLAVREFLAYDCDPGIAFVRKPSDVQRIDQVFVQTVKSVGSVFEKFTDSFPSLTEAKGESHVRKSSNDLSRTPPDVWPSGIDPDQIQVLSECVGEEGCKSTHFHKLANAVSSYDKTPCLTHEPEVVAFRDVLEVNHVSLPRLQADGSDGADLAEDLDSDIPLTRCLLDLALQTVEGRDCWVQNENAVKLFKVLLGKFLESYVRSELDESTTPERCLLYLWELTEVLWPGGKLDDSPPSVISPEQRELTRRQARRCLAEFFPAFLPHVIGQEDFEYAIDQVMTSLDQPKLNRHLALCLMDVFVEELFPDICTPALQKQLLQVTDEHYLPVEVPS